MSLGGKRLGKSGLRDRRARQAELERKGKELEAESIEHVETQLAAFKDELAKFASAHKKRINSDPAFRHRFQQMTTAVGVDPLLSSKGFWGKLLGVGDFYFELGVQILDVCISTRPVNGGIMDAKECLDRIQRARTSVSRGAAAAASGRAASRALVSLDDVERAVAQLGALGSGIAIQRVTRPGKPPVAIIVSVPRELSADTATAVAVMGESSGRCTAASLASAAGWTADRAASALAALASDGMVWVDQPSAGAPCEYWLPAGALDA